MQGGKEKQAENYGYIFVTVDGAKEKTIVIWHSGNPRCVKRFDESALPVWYYS